MVENPSRLIRSIQRPLTLYRPRPCTLAKPRTSKFNCALDLKHASLVDKSARTIATLTDSSSPELTDIVKAVVVEGK